MTEQLARRIETTGRPRILVVGDLMLDRYVWGEAARLSPEGPIPVLDVTSEEARPGGAGNVALALTHLGARPTVCGIVGDDPEGQALRDQLAGLDGGAEGVIACAGRPTTVKTRFIGYVQSARRGIQQLLRVDRETRLPVSPADETALIARITALAGECDAIALSDYNKGLLTEAVLAAAVAAARRRKIPVITDPKVGRSYALYRGSAVLTPNRYEAQTATGVTLKDDASYEQAARKLIEVAGLEHALITLDRDGMFLLSRNGDSLRIQTRPREVVDVTGAGDVVVAVMTMLLAEGAPVADAARIANTAAGIEVSRIGAAPVYRQEILAELMAGGGVNAKLKTRDAAVALAREVHRRNGKVVWTNGCFDIFHIGHYEYLRFARQQGDLLIVGLNTDASTRRLKGPNRPITPENERARLLAALDVVDAIVLFDGDTPLPEIEAIEPDVIVKGGDYKSEQDVVGWQVVKARGGRIALAPFVEGASTTNIVKRVLELYGQQ